MKDQLGVSVLGVAEHLDRMLLRKSAMPLLHNLGPNSEKKYPEMKVIWQSSDMPETPRLLPLSVRLTVDDELHIFADAVEPSYFEGIVFNPGTPEMKLIYSRNDILSADIYLMPDISEDDSQWTREDDMSIAEIRHRDPFGVVAHFTAVFVCEKTYWFKLLAKLLREKMAVNVNIVTEDKTSRQRRFEG